MPVDSFHPNYREFLGQWTRCRDVLSGSDAVKKKGTTYLPRLTGQSSDEYAAYLRRALFFSVSGRSLDGLVGMATRKPAQTEFDPSLSSYFEDSSQSRMSFVETTRSLTYELLSTGRLFAWVDWPVSGGLGSIHITKVEDAINWRLDDEGNLLWVMIAAVTTSVSSTDMYDTEDVLTFKKLSVEDGYYTITIFDSDLNEVERITPFIPGFEVNRIPGVFVNANGLSVDIIKPPMLDIVDVNLSQYLTSADLEHGRHFTALPTPVVSGVSGDTALKIGSQTAWAIPEKAKAYFLEFEGLGLASLEKAMAEKTTQMAQFSSRLMDTSTRGSEAVDTVRLRHSSEAATLASVVGAVESTLDFLFDIISKSHRVEKPVIKLNKNFLDSRLSGSDLDYLTKAYLSGAIDEETFFFNLDRGELVPKGKDRFDSKPKDTKTDADS